LRLTLTRSRHTWTRPRSVHSITGSPITCGRATLHTRPPALPRGRPRGTARAPRRLSGQHLQVAQRRQQELGLCGELRHPAERAPAIHLLPAPNTISCPGGTAHARTSPPGTHGAAGRAHAPVRARSQRASGSPCSCRCSGAPTPARRAQRIARDRRAPRGRRCAGLRAWSRSLDVERKPSSTPPRQPDSSGSRNAEGSRTPAMPRNTLRLPGSFVH